MDNRLGQYPAFPSESKGRYGDIKVHNQGLSARIYLAGMAMQGILAGDSTTLTYESNESALCKENRHYKYDYSKIAKNAIRLADELLKQESE